MKQQTKIISCIVNGSICVTYSKIKKMINQEKQRLNCKYKIQLKKFVWYLENISSQINLFFQFQNSISAQGLRFEQVELVTQFS